MDAQQNGQQTDTNALHQQQQAHQQVGHNHGVPPNMAQAPAMQYIPAPNLPQAQSPEQLLRQGPQIQHFGNPNLWQTLTQKNIVGTGDFEKTEVCEIPAFGLLLKHTSCINGHVAVSMVMGPSLKLAQAIDKRTKQPLVDPISGAPLPAIVGISK